MAFLNRLIVREGDDFFSTHPGSAVGAVRATLNSSDIRIDYVGHTLVALAKGVAAMDQEETGGDAVVASSPKLDAQGLIFHADPSLHTV